MPSVGRLAEVYLDENPDDPDFEKFDEWLKSEHGHEVMLDELMFWLEHCLEGNNIGSHFVEEFDK